MDYEARLSKMNNHLRAHPHDYQTVVSMLKMHSRAIDHERKQRMNARLRTLAEIRRKNNGEESEQ